MGQTGGGEREIGEDEARAGALAIGILDALERLPRGVEDELEERIEAVDLRGREREAARIEAVFEPADVPTAQARDPIRGGAARRGHELFGIDAPPPLGDRAEQILAGEDTVEQLLRAEGAGEGVRLGDDRDRFEAVQEGLGYAFAAVSTMCISMPRSSQRRRPSSVRTIASETVFMSVTERERMEQCSGPVVGSSM